MASFNKVILVGNLTRDPDLRVTPNGNSICKLGLAASRKYKTREGEIQEETTFVDIDAFGKSAEIIAKYMRKGRPIMIEGHLRLDQWETKEGQKRSKLGVVCENFQFLGGREDNPSGSSAGYEKKSPPARSPGGGDASSAQESGAGSGSGASDDDALESDVPF